MVGLCTVLGHVSFALHSELLCLCRSATDGEGQRPNPVRFSERSNFEFSLDGRRGHKLWIGWCGRSSDTRSNSYTSSVRTFRGRTRGAQSRSHGQQHKAVQQMLHARILAGTRMLVCWQAARRRLLLFLDHFSVSFCGKIFPLLVVLSRLSSFFGGQRN